MSIQIVSHTSHSKLVEKQGMGEIANAQKLKELLELSNYKVKKILDIYDLFGGGIQGAYNIAQIAAINGALVQEGHQAIENFQLHYTDVIWDKLNQKRNEIQALMVLTWDFNLAAFLGVGIHRMMPTISKCYTFHEKEKISSSLFSPTDLVITESLLGSLKAIDAGIPPWKVAYLPHHFLQHLPTCSSYKKSYLKKIAKKNNKPTPHSNSLIIGLFGRFQYRKNVEFAIRAIQELYKKNNNLLLLIKGDFDQSADLFEGVGYSELLLKEIEGVIDEPWFFWDKSFTPLPEVLMQYASCDILLNLSGAESASNSVVEFMSLQKPCIVLNNSTNPYLFGEGVAKVKVKESFKKGKMFFQEPDFENLLEVLEKLISKEDGRKELGRRAQTIAIERFSPQLTLERIPLMIGASKAYHENKNVKAFQKAIVQLFKEDLKLYGLSTNF